jgi:hypothetical protein
MENKLSTFLEQLLEAEKARYRLNLPLHSKLRILKREKNIDSKNVSKIHDEQSNLIKRILAKNDDLKFEILTINKDLEVLIAIDKYLKFKELFDKLEEEVKAIGIVQTFINHINESGKKSIIDSISSKKRIAKKGLKLLLKQTQEAQAWIIKIHMNGHAIRNFAERRKVEKKILFTSGKTGNKSFMNKIPEEKEDRYENLKELVHDFYKIKVELIKFERQLENQTEYPNLKKET